MYAAAGGASIANRRKQKRLQLNKRDGSSAQAAAARARSISATGAGIGQHASHQQIGKFSTGQHAIPTLQLQIPPTTVQPTYGFHSSHEHRSRTNRRTGQNERKSSSSVANNYHNNHHHNTDHNRHRLLAPPPISPIVQFPISPPPLSLESPNSLINNSTQAIANKSNNCNNNYSSSAAAVAFPFPPPSSLDLRVSTSTSELQCGGQGPGKAAWQGCARPSPLPLSPASPQGSRGEGYKTKQCEAHRRWMKRNRVKHNKATIIQCNKIRDASYCYGSSGEDDEYDEYEDGIIGPDSSHGGRTSARRRAGEVNAAVNTVLYAGLGTTALGLVISFVGTGEKGFLSPELRLVGPSLLCAGLLCCLLRVLLCLCLCRCCGECRWRPCKMLNISKETKKKSSGREKNNRSGKTEMIAASSTSATSAAAAAAVAGAAVSSSQSNKRGQTATLLPVHPPSTSQRQQPPVPSSSSCSTAKSHKGHELLLSPAQLPE